MAEFPGKVVSITDVEFSVQHARQRQHKIGIHKQPVRLQGATETRRGLLERRRSVLRTETAGNQPVRNEQREMPAAVFVQRHASRLRLPSRPSRARRKNMPG